MTRDDHEPTVDGPSRGGTRLRAVAGPLDAPEPRPAVRLVREFKGPTVADLVRDEYADRLPGRVRTAQHHLERGELASAERALPGSFVPVLEGPGHARARLRRTLVAAVLALAFAATALAAWLAR